MVFEIQVLVWDKNVTAHDIGNPYLDLGQAQKLKWLMVSQPFPFLYVFFLLITNLVTRVITYSVEIAL